MKAKHQKIFDISVSFFVIITTCADKFASFDSLPRHFSITALLLFIICLVLLRFLPKFCVSPAKVALLLVYCVTFCELFQETAQNQPFLLVEFTIFANLLLINEKNPAICAVFPVITLFFVVNSKNSTNIYEISAILLSLGLVLAKFLNGIHEKSEEKLKETAKTEENLYKKLLFDRRDLGIARIELKSQRDCALEKNKSFSLKFLKQRFQKLIKSYKSTTNFTVSHASSSKLLDFPSKLCVTDANYALKKRFNGDLLEKPGDFFGFLDAFPAESLEIHGHGGILTIASHKSIDLEGPKSRICGIMHEILQKLAKTSKSSDFSRTIRIRVRASSEKNLEKLELVPFCGVSLLLLATFSEKPGRKSDDEGNFPEDYKELRRSNEMKDKLFASISHDMRSPLSAVIYYTKSAKDCENSAQRNEKLDFALMNANLLLMLVNDFLDFSLFANNRKLSSIPTKFTLQTLLNEVYSMIVMEATNKNINISFELRDVGDNLSFKSDERRLKQVLVNLFTNAIKFTFQGYVKLRISQVPTHDNLLKFEVLDTGKGIRAEVLPKLMTPFATFDLPDQKINGGGIGLGLFICKTLAGVIGPESNLFIYSEEGKGTKVGFLAYIMKGSDESIREEKKEKFEEFFDKELEYFMEENVLQSDMREVLVKSRNIPKEGFLQKSLKFVRKNSEKKPSITVLRTMGSNNNENYKKSMTCFSNSNNNNNIINSVCNSNTSPKQNGSNTNFNSNNIINNNSLINNTLNNLNMLNNSYHTGESLKKIVAINDGATNNSNKSPRKKLISLQPSNTIEEELKNPIPNDQHYVLIVDDHSFILMMLIDMIKSYKEKNIVIEKASHGLAAVQMFSARNAPNSLENPYEIIFMDNEMPVMRGYEAARVIKSKIFKEGYKDVKIIGCSGDSVDIHNRSGKSQELLGIDDVLVKPYGVEMMHECLKKYL